MISMGNSRRVVLLKSNFVAPAAIEFITTLPWYFQYYELAVGRTENLIGCHRRWGRNKRTRKSKLDRKLEEPCIDIK